MTRIAPIKFAALILLLSAGVCTAASLDDYRSRTKQARTQVSILMDAVAQEEFGSSRPIGETAAGVKRLIPISEKVEWPGGEIQTSNEWLHSELDQAVSESDLTKRAVLLSSADERLAAIEKSIDELSQANASGGPSKDEEKKKLGEILERSEYKKAPEPEESLFQKWMRELREWLDSVFPSGPRISPASGVGLQGIGGVLQILIYVIVIGLVGFLIYKLLPFFSGRFARGIIERTDDRVILGERISAESSSTDLMAEAERLAREGDLRGAIRKGYIALLCELSDRRLIALAQHKSNRDYLREIRGRRELYPSVNGLTSQFEVSWYGLREADAQDWERFLSTYRETLTNI